MHKIRTIKYLVYENSYQENKTKTQNNQKGDIDTSFCLWSMHEILWIFFIYFTVHKTTVI